MSDSAGFGGSGVLPLTFFSPFFSAFFSFLASLFFGFLSFLGDPSGGPGAGGKVSSEKCTDAGLDVRLAGRRIPFVGEAGTARGGGGGGGGGAGPACRKSVQSYHTTSNT